MSKIIGVILALLLLIPGLFTFIPSKSYAAPCTVSTRTAGGSTLFFSVTWSDINPGDSYTFLLMEVGGGTLIPENTRLATTPFDDLIDPLLYYSSAGALVATPLNIYPYIGKTVQLTVYRGDIMGSGGICTATITLTASGSVCDCTFPEPNPSCPSKIQMVPGKRNSSGVCEWIPGCAPPACQGQNPCDGGICPTALGNIPSNPTVFAQKILQIGIGLAGGIALILMVIGSVRVLTSSGDQQRLNGGRDMIIAAVSGLLFLIFAVMILRFIGFNIIGFP